MIQPSYAKEVAQTEASSGAAAPPFVAEAVAKLLTSMWLGPTRPTMMPTMAIRPSGMSLMTVVVVWNLPASFGLRALTT